MLTRMSRPIGGREAGIVAGTPALTADLGCGDSAAGAVRGSPLGGVADWNRATEGTVAGVALKPPPSTGAPGAALPVRPPRAGTIDGVVLPRAPLASSSSISLSSRS